MSLEASPSQMFSMVLSRKSNAVPCPSALLTLPTARSFPAAYLRGPARLPRLPGASLPQGLCLLIPHRSQIGPERTQRQKGHKSLKHRQMLCPPASASSTAEVFPFTRTKTLPAPSPKAAVGFSWDTLPKSTEILLVCPPQTSKHALFKEVNSSVHYLLHSTSFCAARSQAGSTKPPPAQPKMLGAEALRCSCCRPSLLALASCNLLPSSV